MSEQARPTRTLLYLGTEVGYDKGHFPKARHSQWLKLDGIDNDGRPILEIITPAQFSERECLYSVKTGRGKGRAGAIWVFETAEETKIYPDTAKCLGRWKNDEDVTRWQAKEEVVRKEIALATRAAQEIAENLPMEALKPFRTAWWGLSTRQRGILLAHVMAYITGGNVKGND